MAKKDKPKKDPLERLRNKLEKAGLKLNKDGTRIIGGEAGSFGSREQLELAQQAYERFGIESNPFFDPRRVAYDPSVKASPGSKAGRFIDLATGVYTSGQGVASDELLELLRARTGYDIAYEQEYRARASSFERQVGVDEKGEPIYETYTPVAFRTPESFAAYAAAARQNYLNPPEPADDEGAGGEEEIGPQVPMGLGSSGGTSTGRAGGLPGGRLSNLASTFDTFDDETLTGIGDVAANLLQRRQAKQAAQQSYGPYFAYDDFFGEEE